jgi:hypothetical protein
MCKRLFLLTLLISLLLGVSSYAVPVGIFEDATDVGGPTGIGSTLYDPVADQYLITGGGSDIWNNSDQFQYAYNTVSGDVRLSASFDWVCASNDWAKYGVMLRESLAGESVHYTMLDRKDQTYCAMQGRTSTGGSSSAFGLEWASGAQALAIQRVTVAGLTAIEGLADFGSGWESRAVQLVFGLPDELLAGVAVTSHDNNQLVQAYAWNVVYEENPELVGSLPVPTVPASAALAEACSDVSGMSIRSLKPLVTDNWGYDAMTTLLDTGTYMGLPAMPGSEGTRIEQFVNLHDTDSRGSFSEANGYPDQSFPGIDPFESPTADPAAGDDDDYFATEVLGCIQLTAGIHIIGSWHDDGVWIEIGGVEVGANSGWGGPHDFVFEVEADGYYDLRVRNLEGTGGAALELHEVMLDGTRILLNDVANGGSAVFAPAQ